MADEDYFIVTPQDAEGLPLLDQQFDVSEKVAIKMRALEALKARTSETNRLHLNPPVAHIPRLDRAAASDAHIVGETVESYCGADWHPTNVIPEGMTADWADRNCCPLCLSERFGRPPKYYETKYFPKPWIKDPIRYAN